MSRPPLTPAYWQWAEAEDGDGHVRRWENAELRVISAKRARKLKKRGIQVEHDTMPSGRRVHYWFVKRREK